MVGYESSFAVRKDEETLEKLVLSEGVLLYAESENSWRMDAICWNGLQNSNLFIWNNASKTIGVGLFFALIEWYTINWENICSGRG